jgi:hypothetical protein
MEIGEAEAIAGQFVEVRSPDLATKAANITEAQVIRYNDKEVGTLSSACA